MLRTFTTSTLRNTTELTGQLWQFTPIEGNLSDTTLYNRTLPVSTPSCWETYPDFTSFRGVADYATTFTAKGNLRLVFKGVSHTGHVYLNDQYLGMHYNAFTPFDFIIPGAEEDTHELLVRVDNRFSEESALHIPNDYMTYGGITRPVAVEEIADQYIDTFHIVPQFEDGLWYADITLEASNLSVDPCTVQLSVTVADGYTSTELLIPGSGKAGTKLRIPCPNVIPWDVGDPHLYTAVAILSVDGTPIDDQIDRIGFRTVSISGTRILLNDRPIRIKGFCRHEDHPEFGCALPYPAIMYDLNLIRHLGANSVRTSHYPNDEIFLDLCDEMGILVWEESHARGLELDRMKNPNFEPQAEACIHEMIHAHMNHPCIYIWGILNECASETEYGAQCYKAQYDLIQELDPSRPRSSASCRFGNDITLGFPEVVSYNMYPDWYLTDNTATYLDKLYSWIQNDTEGAGKPFLITEIGAGAIYGYRTPTHAKWSEEYQVQALADQIRSGFSHPEVCGIYIWQFCDVRISDEWFSSRPRTMNNKGIVDEYRRRKLSYDTVKALYESYSDHLDD